MVKDMQLGVASHVLQVDRIEFSKEKHLYRLDLSWINDVIL